ncbi:glycosyltransferase [Intestinibacter bartlettii]|uniref:glycosyltransferase n=1 Tax=Intestinibacter bartlettii TaxID=261299 RepID=UPI00290D9391|nr:glycosyltransferase [Intestinibacter bartlettii]MDU6472958.1 glycosyltransferase [Intestinibacter bartlettii]
MKKNILILMPSMFIGGAERSLIGLMESIDYTKYNIDLFLYRQEGELLKFIPNKVNLLPQISSYTNFDRPIKDVLFSKNFRFGLKRLKAKIDIKKRGQENVWSSLQYIYHNIMPLLPNLDKEYDLAINFLNPAEILVEKVNAKKKIAWIHTDYTKIVPDKELDLKVYSNVDYIANVSKTCEEQFLSIYNQLEDKCIVVENILSENFIKEQSQEKIMDKQFNDGDEETIKILSIGRYDGAKNFDNVPEICSNILKNGYKVKWYIIGFGTDENLIKEKIKEFNMQDNIILLGKKENPYPYIKGCDIYVQPSRYEGKSVAVREAQILNKPVVITNFETSKSQLIDVFDGIIVPMDNEGCAEGIYNLIKDKELQQRLIENTKITDYTNKQELEKIYALLEG